MSVFEKGKTNKQHSLFKRKKSRYLFVDRSKYYKKICMVFGVINLLLISTIFFTGTKNDFTEITCGKLNETDNFSFSVVDILYNENTQALQTKIYIESDTLPLGLTQSKISAKTFKQNGTTFSSSIQKIDENFFVVNTKNVPKDTKVVKQEISFSPKIKNETGDSISSFDGTIKFFILDLVQKKKLVSQSIENLKNESELFRQKILSEKIQNKENQIQKIQNEKKNLEEVQATYEEKITELDETERKKVEEEITVLLQQQETKNQTIQNLQNEKLALEEKLKFEIQKNK